MESKIENKIEFTSADKWGLFGRNFRGAWLAGFNLLPNHEQEGLLTKIPLAFATLIHVFNVGFFTSLGSAAVKTLVDIQTREPLTDLQYKTTGDFLVNAKGSNIGQIVIDMLFIDASSNSSIALIGKLTELNTEIETIKEAMRHQIIAETNHDFENNPIIAQKRIEQKTLLRDYFQSDLNKGKKTQRSIYESVTQLIEQSERTDKISIENFTI